ncbi:MAG: SURF1 family protein [Alphaproteobacteria bacterium]|nr:SURF1 family protein [Alphaproteobacteria bacterium]
MPSDRLSRRAAFRPRLVPTLIALPLFAGLLALGFWQVERLEEKTELNAYRAGRAAVPPIDLPDDPAALSKLDASQLDFRRVRVQGRLANDREIYVYEPSQKGDAGYHVVTPLLRGAGRPLLVDRGWVPPERKAPASRAPGEVAGTATITGFVRRGQVRGWLTPDNDPAHDSWFWFDLPAMSKAAGIEPPASFYLEADATPNPGGLPVGGQTPIELPSPHLNYAITWFSLAGALAVIFVASQRRG